MSFTNYLLFALIFECSYFLIWAIFEKTLLLESIKRIAFFAAVFIIFKLWKWR